MAFGRRHRERVAAHGKRSRWSVRIFGPTPVVPLSLAHGVAAAAGDAFVTVSLAGSLFFNVSPDASRQQVLLYLLVTMAPLAVLAPLIGPAVDRFRGSQRYVAAICYLLRGVFALALSTTLYQLSFYPFALGLLVASKASGIIKQALIPVLVEDPGRLVAANARLARLGSISGGVFGGLATIVLATAGAPWVLRIASMAFAVAALIVLWVRPRGPVARTDDDIVYAEMHLPTVFVSSVGFMAIRAAVGFFVFTMAFTFRRASEPALVYGIAVFAYGAGALAGHEISWWLRRRFKEEQLIAISLISPAALTLVGVLGVSRPLLIATAALVGVSTTLGRHAFESLLQQRAPDALRGRASAHYETRFQLAWVIGGVLATPISLPVEVSMAVLTLIYIPGLVLYVRAATAARQFEQGPGDALSAAMARLASAEQARQVGAVRAAIVDASAAIDLAQIAHGGPTEAGGRRVLDELRLAAIDPTREVDDDDAQRALALAYELIKPAAPLT